MDVNDGMAEASAYMHALRRDAEGLLARNGTGCAGDNYCMGCPIEVGGMAEVSANVHALRRDAEGLLARQGTVAASNTSSSLQPHHQPLVAHRPTGKCAVEAARSLILVHSRHAHQTTCSDTPDSSAGLS